MGNHMLRGTAALCLIFALYAATAVADEPLPAGDKQEASEAVEERKGWQVFFGAANLWPKLNESEDKVDRLINNGVGRLFPTWEKPVTFKDWRDDFRLWDFQVGVSRELNEYWDWYFSVGAVYGYQPNSERYFLLGVPVKIDVDFERSVLFFSTGADFYPKGRPELPEGAGHSVWQRIRAAKPFGELCLTYVDLKGKCEGTFNLPVIGKVAHYQDKARYDLIGIAPRVGFDIPVTRKDSVSIAVGPIMFTSHENEFNNISICTVLRHRF